MNYYQFLERVIEDGIAAAKADYRDPKDKSKLEGSLEGFEACRKKLPEDLLELHREALLAQSKAFQKSRDNPDAYWKVNCRWLEIEWVCNVISLLNHLKKPVIVIPTARGVMKDIDVISDGVSNSCEGD